MELIAPKELIDASIVKSPRAAQFLMSLLQINKVNKLYQGNPNADALPFLEQTVSDLQLRSEVLDTDLMNIPKTGPFIIVANHPFGVIDGILLLHTVLRVRPDFKVMANFMLQRIAPLENHFFSVNPFEIGSRSSSSYRGIKQAMQHLAQGHPLGIFPSGEVSSFNKDYPGLTDKKWDSATLKLIHNAKVPIIPVYFKGSNSWMFHLLGLLNPVLRTAKLPSEALNKKNKPVKIRIGAAIMPREQTEYADAKELGRHVRSLVYALGSTLEPQRLFTPVWQKPAVQEDIIAPQNVEVLESEIDALEKSGHLLFRINQYSIFCAPTQNISALLYEIGRLRELTYRGVGEGTNRSFDTDEFDSYYRQLFIWDHAARRLVGGYRIGFGKDILQHYGRTGFYTNTLFTFSNEFRPVLSQSLELGRSFIVPEYQRKSMPLFMLWKGILYTLLRNPEYRYLMGPVSISNDFTKVSKKLIIDFVRQNYMDHQYASFVKPRNKVRMRNRSQDLHTIIEHAGGSIEKLDRSIKKLETNGLSVPVLLKKYLELNGRILGFNVDPAFNNCIDGLLLIDLFDIPVEVIQSFSKELKDNSLLTNILDRNTIKEMLQA